MLRDRLKFTGELRAVGGGVKQDKIFLLARCGFESFELPPEEKADEALAALRRYDVFISRRNLSRVLSSSLVLRV